MADIVEFPAKRVAPDALPGAGDCYQAFGLVHRFAAPMFVFLFPDWSIAALRYDRLERLSFYSPGEAGHAEDVITLLCGGKVGPGMIAVITGCGLHDLFAYLGQHRVQWMWVLPKDRAAASDGASVIHAIELKEANAENLASLLS